MEDMPWFIKRADGLYYRGGKAEDDSSWKDGRLDCVTFKTEGAAQERIRDLGMQDAEPEGY